MLFNKAKYYSAEEIELIKQSTLLVGKTLGEVAKHIAPGVPTTLLDTVAEEYIRDNHGFPSFKGYNGFPATLCISVNDVVVHGFPSNTPLQNGDIVTVDCGACVNGYHGDYAYTFAVGNVSEEKSLLMERTKHSLTLGINAAKEGNTIGDIGFAIQQYVETFHYGVVRELCGHGIGKHVHEFPDVPNFGLPHQGVKLHKGMVICIEPMITAGKRHIFCESDQWTIRTSDGSPAAHYEAQVAITDKGTEVLSTYKFIDEVLNAK